MNSNFIFFLNGASSSGKSSIVKEIIDLYDRLILDLAIDNMVCIVPGKFLKADAFIYYGNKSTVAEPEIDLLEDRYFGYQMEMFPKYISGFHKSILAFYQAGNSVILDHVLQEEEWHKECAQLFYYSNAYFTGIDCLLDVLICREIRRKDRPIRKAEYQYPNIHGKDIYDFRVDTARNTAEECTEDILAYIDNNRTSAFREIFNKFET